MYLTCALHKFFKIMLRLYSIYHEVYPEFIKQLENSAALQRIDRIDMNCGVNYTSYPLFRDLQPYSRLQHSIGTALIIYHFTHDTVQSLAGLMHDIATPAFSHTIDFMNGDYIKQESTEENTRMCIEKDPCISHFLSITNISIEKVCDYHIYPIADNPSPQLSADRLEYTLSNACNYHFASKKDIADIYADIIVGTNENNVQELVFQHSEQAERFAYLALQCGKVYVSLQDRFAMEALARLTKTCLQKHVLEMNDLWKDEFYVIDKICRSQYSQAWAKYCSLSSVQESDTGICIYAKKRYIDPYVLGKGRICSIRDTIKHDVDSFLKDDMHEKLIGECQDGRKYNCGCEWEPR